MKARVKRIILPNNYIRSMLADNISGPIRVVRLVPVNQEPDELEKENSEVMDDIRKLINVNTEDKIDHSEKNEKSKISEDVEVTTTLNDILNGIMAKLAVKNDVRIESLNNVGLYPNGKYYGNTVVNITCSHIYSGIYGYTKCNDGSYMLRIRIDLMDRNHNVKTVEVTYDPTMWYEYDPANFVGHMYDSEVVGWKKFLDHVNDRFYREYFNTL